MKLGYNQVENVILAALAEDIGKADITSESCVPKKMKASAKIIAKQNGIICGLQVIEFIFKIIDSKVSLKLKKKDGSKIKKNDVIAEIKGNARSLLLTERTILNFLQQLSGVATTTYDYVKKIKNYNTKILDTRKTIPGMRYLQKYAVKCGKGENHRRGLYDMVLIKENHITASSITKSVSLARKKYPKMKIEVECSTLADVKEALQTDCDWIMLDNMNPSVIKKALKIINRKKITEASGGITLKNITSYAKTGVDYISCGAITHSYKALDISMYITFK